MFDISEIINIAFVSAAIVNSYCVSGCVVFIIPIERITLNIQTQDNAVFTGREFGRKYSFGKIQRPVIVAHQVKPFKHRINSPFKIFKIISVSIPADFGKRVNTGKYHIFGMVFFRNVLSPKATVRTEYELLFFGR